ncbi:thiamine pyrophosphate-dependent protein [Mycolicibacterium agri]|uniref:acetolactate synthase n=1 Tax=Mycolicibacterium agri TaxID=36811 RepID=A0A2A7MYC6_MYCAG|nr:thiamine pyrophosphate-binding protein [Mycolicibacterium agri]PEG36560.1 thiamine pyrophosphate-dependent protein [Mycolicibacterium agri]GFG52024.1 acetolactate synthase [Mycolicibacterium agri]
MTKTGRTFGRVVDHIVGYLADTGVEYIFGVDGANIEDLYDAAYFRDGITAILAKHEFSAATMADGYSRSGGGLGVVAATSGGGCLNTVAGLGESYASRVPVLALIGQPPTALDGRGAFQDTSGRNGALNGQALFSAVSVFCRRVTSPEDIVTALPEAIAAARRGGPAVLLLPKDIQQAEMPARGLHNGANGFDCFGFGALLGDPQIITRALRRADGPVTIIAGEQVARDDARAELAQLRSMLRARVAVVPDAKDVAGTPGLGLSSALGVTGVMGHPGVAEAIADSALCLLVGTRLNVTARAGLDDVLASVPTYSIGSATPFVTTTHVHTEDLRGSLRLLTQALNGEGRPTGVRVPDEVPRTELAPPPHDGLGVRYRAAMAQLDAVLPAGVDIVVDAGNIGASAIHYLPGRRDGRFIVALGMGGMGYSFGAGLGVAFSRKRRTVVIAGDGSFFMHGMEIHTALQYRLPVTFLLFDNHAHAMCVTREQLFYGDHYSYNRFGASRLGAGLATMFPGLASVDVGTIDELPAALRAALEVDGPSVVSVECSADEIPPFAAFLGKAAVKNTDIAEENSSHVATRA